ncbi:hypothetical protein Tco_1512132, partial [Tanacetum coccineum]
MSTSSTSPFTLRSFFKKEKLNGSNYLDWLRNSRLVLRDAYAKQKRESTKVAVLMCMSMALDLRKSFNGHGAYDIAVQLKEMFQQQATQERFQTMRALLTTRQKEGESVSKHVLNLKMYVD